MYEHLFKHRCVMNGQIYFRAPTELVNSHLSKLAINRGLTAVRSSGEPWSYYQVCCSGLRARINDHNKAASEKGYEEDDPLLFPIGQNASHFCTRTSTHMPALLKQSMMYSRRLKVLAALRGAGSARPQALRDS